MSGAENEHLLRITTTQIHQNHPNTFKRYFIEGNSHYIADFYNQVNGVTVWMWLDATEDWIVYHANNSSNGDCDMKRTPRVQKFTWNADGMPNFGSPISVDINLAVPAGESGPVSTPSR